MMAKTIVVVPCFNEAARLPETDFRAFITPRGVGARMGMWEQLGHTSGLQRVAIAKDSGLPRPVIRLSMLQAINASASCELG